MWHMVYPWPQRPAGIVEEAFAELGRRWRGDPTILAWDLTDEPPFWIAPDTTDAMAVNWTRLVAGGLRAGPRAGRLAEWAAVSF